MNHISEPLQTNHILTTINEILAASEKKKNERKEKAATMDWKKKKYGSFKSQVQTLLRDFF